MKYIYKSLPNTKSNDIMSSPSSNGLTKGEASTISKDTFKEGKKTMEKLNDLINIHGKTLTSPMSPAPFKSNTGEISPVYSTHQLNEEDIAETERRKKVEKEKQRYAELQQTQKQEFPSHYVSPVVQAYMDEHANDLSNPINSIPPPSFTVTISVHRLTDLGPPHLLSITDPYVAVRFYIDDKLFTQTRLKKFQSSEIDFQMVDERKNHKDDDNNTITIELNKDKPEAIRLELVQMNRRGIIGNFLGMCEIDYKTELQDGSSDGSEIISHRLRKKLDASRATQRYVQGRINISLITIQPLIPTI